MKKTIICIVGQLVSLTTYSQVRLTMSDAIKYAIEKNLQVKQAKISEGLANYDLYKAKVSIYPNLNLSSTGNLSFGRSLDPTNNTYVTQRIVTSSDNISSTVVLFGGFQRLNKIRETMLLLNANKSNTEKTKNELTLTVISKFLTALNYKDELTAANNQMNLATAQLEYATRSFEVGRKTTADVSRARYQVSKTQTNTAHIKNQFNTAILDLTQLLNFDPSVGISLVEPQEQGDAISDEIAGSHIYNTAVKNFPDIKVAEYSYLAALKELSVQRGGFYPTLSLNMAMASNFSHTPEPASIFYRPDAPFLEQLRQNRYEYIGLSLNVPIFNNFLAKIQVARQKLNVESALVNVEIAKSNLYKAIKQALGDLEEAKENYNYAKQSFESSTQTLEVVQKRYKNGLSSSLELNQAQNDVSESEFAVIHNKYEVVFRAKVIDFYLGKPITY